MKVTRWVSLLIAGLLLMLPSVGLAWAPEGWFDTLEALPTAIRSELPADESFLKSFYNGDTAYVCTETSGGAQRIHIFRETNGDWALLLSSISFPKVNGNAPYFGSTSSSRLYLFSGDDCFVFSESAKAEWRLSYVQSDATDTSDFYWLPNGIRWEDEYGTHAIYGNLPSFLLADMDPALLPYTLAQARRLLQVEDWAVVSNPNPQDRLHLRAKPSQDAPSLGKYYSGTPVHILQTQGDWAQVDIYGVQGYMMLRYLVLGEAMETVPSAFPYRVVTQKAAVEGVKIYAQPELSSPVTAIVGKGFSDAPIRQFHIIGVVGDEWYHVALDDDQSGYVRAEDFWEGNG